MADDVGSSSLPAYLRHATTGARFCQLSFMTILPATVASSFDTETKAALVHEHVHFFQSVTTLSGLNAMLRWWNVVSAVSHHFSTRRVVDMAELIAEYDEHIERLEELSHPLPLGDADVGLTLREVDDRQVFGLTRASEAGSLFFPFGGMTLQESMAMAVEQHRGLSRPTYDKVRESPGRGFIYAAASEAIAGELGRGDDLWWVTALLCQVALDHVSPQMAFMQGLDALASRWKSLPPATALPEAHELVRAATRHELVEEDRARLLEEATDLVDRGRRGTDPFDRAVAKLFDHIKRGTTRWYEDPVGLFDAFLFRPASSGLLDEFALPLYQAEGRLLSQTDDEDLRNAVLFLTLMSHRIQALIGRITDHRCPMLHNTGCEWARTNECESAPWHRAAEDEQVCAYRVIESALHGYASSGSAR